MSGWPRALATIEQRIAARTVINDSGCWVWQGGQNGAGYGRMRELGGGAQRLVHRLAYQVHRGPIPNGMDLDHLCRNTLCCNPQHLEAVPHCENIRRGWAAVRTHCKEGHALAGDNLVKSAPSRRCRTCHNARQRALRKSQLAPGKA